MAGFVKHQVWTRATDRRRETEAGFTLIELLVVISIVSVLISMLLPVLAASRRTAQGIQCMNNQRQIGVAFMMYGMDYDDWINPIRSRHAAYWAGGAVGGRPWHERLMHLGPQSPNDYGLRYGSWEEGRGTFECPAEERSGGNYHHYGGNSYVMGNIYHANPLYKEMHQFEGLYRSPTEVILITDTDRIPPSTADDAITAPSFMAFRHGENASTLMADGRVAPMDESHFTEAPYGGTRRLRHGSKHQAP